MAERKNPARMTKKSADVHPLDRPKNKQARNTKGSAMSSTETGSRKKAGTLSLFDNMGAEVLDPGVESAKKTAPNRGTNSRSPEAATPVKRATGASGSEKGDATAKSASRKTANARVSEGRTATGGNSRPGDKAKSLSKKTGDNKTSGNKGKATSNKATPVTAGKGTTASSKTKAPATAGKTGTSGSGGKATRTKSGNPKTTTPARKGERTSSGKMKAKNV